MNKVVKIVRCNAGKRVSSAARPPAQVEYKPGCWAEAPEWLATQGYHLMVFDSLENALRFRPPDWKLTPLEFWWAEAGNVREPDLPPLALLWLSWGQFEESPWPWSQGTLFAEKVRLVRKVSKKELEKATLAIR